jgi:hypothetical protein
MIILSFGEHNPSYAIQNVEGEGGLCHCEAHRAEAISFRRFLKNKYRAAEKQKDQDPEQTPLDKLIFT